MNISCIYGYKWNDECGCESKYLKETKVNKNIDIGINVCVNVNVNLEKYE